MTEHACENCVFEQRRRCRGVFLPQKWGCGHGHTGRMRSLAGGMTVLCFTGQRSPSCQMTVVHATYRYLSLLGGGAWVSGVASPVARMRSPRDLIWRLSAASEIVRVIESP